jgi:predicted nucleic acid-binding protein
MSRIYWDTMLFVYLLEDHPTYGSIVNRIRLRMQEREDDLYTASLSLGEILVAPYRCNEPVRMKKVEEFFRNAGIKILPFSANTARHYANIRSRMNVSPPDAIHLACAAEAGVDLFLTNDSTLTRKVVPGIQFITSLQTDLF